MTTEDDRRAQRDLHGASLDLSVRLDGVDERFRDHLWDIATNALKGALLPIAEHVTVSTIDLDQGDDYERDSCSCGYPIVLVDGEWEHDAAPSMWGDDHDAEPG